MVNSINSMTVLKLLALLGHTEYVYIKNYIIVVDDNELAPPLLTRDLKNGNK